MVCTQWQRLQCWRTVNILQLSQNQNLIVKIAKLRLEGPSLLVVPNSKPTCHFKSVLLYQIHLQAAYHEVLHPNSFKAKHDETSKQEMVQRKALQAMEKQQKILVLWPFPSFVFWCCLIILGCLSFFFCVISFQRMPWKRDEQDLHLLPCDRQN